MLIGKRNRGTARGPLALDGNRISKRLIHVKRRSGKASDVSIVFTEESAKESAMRRLLPGLLSGHGPLSDG